MGLKASFLQSDGVLAEWEEPVEEPGRRRQRTLSLFLLLLSEKRTEEEKEDVSALEDI